MDSNKVTINPTLKHELISVDDFKEDLNVRRWNVTGHLLANQLTPYM